MAEVPGVELALPKVLEDGVLGWPNGVEVAMGILVEVGIGVEVEVAVGLFVVLELELESVGLVG
jgi:hypothetical protein